MDQFNATFVHLPQYHIAVCKQCRLGVVTAHLASHLSSKHAYLTAKTRKEIIQAVQQEIQALAETEKDVIYPEPKSEPVPHLTVWRDGLRCTADKPDGTPCGYIRRTLEDIQKHCRDQHGWVNTRKRGRAPKGQEGQQPEVGKMWVDGVHCQKFGKAGKLGKLFEVEARQEARQLAHEQVADPIQQQLKTAFQNATAEVEKADKEAESAIQPDNNRYVTNA
jgi:hypothetical protein